jgi:hypothetical protein
MIKHVLLLSSLFIALPAMAEKPALPDTVDSIDLPVRCYSAGRLASYVMGNLYTVNPDLVSVRMVSASKLATSTDVISAVQASYRGEECQMEWASSVIGGSLSCLPKLLSLSCKTVNANMQAADEQLERKIREDLQKPEQQKENSQHE